MGRIWLTALMAVAGSGAVQGAETVHVVVTGKELGRISPWIYGANMPRAGEFRCVTLERVGGNRWTAYNWTNNASNAGNDWHFQNDGFLSKSDEPGAAVTAALGRLKGAEEALLLTVPTAGWVAADKNGNGDVRTEEGYLEKRFVRSEAKKGGPLVVKPDKGGTVYQDEFVHWVKETNPGAMGRAFFSLDNEPDLWAGTHAEVHPAKPTYAEMVEKTVSYAKAIKDVAPGALVFAPVHYGWQGMVNLQGAPDAAKRDFTEFYLTEMAAAERREGRRLLDVYDVHWYPEVQAGGKRIVDHGTDTDSRRARAEAVRSLWDGTYVENSWITQDSLRRPVALLPRLRTKVAKCYPGTKLAVTEYHFGAGGDISGGVAQAEALGVFGKEGVFAACVWPIGKDQRYVAGAFQMYRDFDGKGGKFGDVAVETRVSDVVGMSAYASADSKVRGRVVVVMVNRGWERQRVELQVPGTHRATAWQLCGALPAPVAIAGPEPRGEGMWGFEAPGWSVTTVELNGS